MPPDTEPSARARELVRGAYDLHVHVEPDLAKRRIDDLGLARRFAELGLAGFVLKCTTLADCGARGRRARRGAGCNALGAIAERRRRRIERAGCRDRRAGGRIVWLPTVDSENGRARTVPSRRNNRSGGRSGRVRGSRVANRPVRLTESGLEGCSTSSRADLVLATGHLGRAEIHTSVDAAFAAGVSHVVVTHPDYPTQGVPVDEQRELAGRGAVLERCFAPIHTGKVSWEQTFEAIRATGPEHNVLSTDLGQVANPPVEDGLALMADRLLEAGFSEQDVRTMAVDNTRKLAGA